MEERIAVRSSLSNLEQTILFSTDVGEITLTVLLNDSEIYHKYFAILMDKNGDYLTTLVEANESTRKLRTLRGELETACGILKISIIVCTDLALHFWVINIRR